MTPRTIVELEMIQYAPQNMNKAYKQYTPTYPEAYRQENNNIEVARQKVRSIRATLAENKPMTRREWSQLKITIETNTRLARLKQQFFSCGSPHCLAKRI